MLAKAKAKASPRVSNALGMAEESTRPPSISANNSSRTGTFAGSSQLVHQDVSIHAHHTAIISSVVCASA